MKRGQYILDRWMVGMIEDICRENGIAFVSYSDDWLLELNKDGVHRRIIGYKFDINSSAASSIAGDKVAAWQLLNGHAVPAVEHQLVRTKAGASDDWGTAGTKLVIKPLDGTSGHAVALLAEPNDAFSYMADHPTIAAWTVAPYYDINSERRFIVLDDAVLLQYEKESKEINGLKMFNLGLGAKAKDTIATEEEQHLAIAAVRAVGLRLAAVDIIDTPLGYKVLEVNDGIMMENYMRQSDANRMTAKHVYAQIIDKMMHKRASRS